MELARILIEGAFTCKRPPNNRSSYDTCRAAVRLSASRGKLWDSRPVGALGTFTVILSSCQRSLDTRCRCLRPVSKSFLHSYAGLESPTAVVWPLLCNWPGSQHFDSVWSCAVLRNDKGAKGRTEPLTEALIPDKVGHWDCLPGRHTHSCRSGWCSFILCGGAGRRTACYITLQGRTCMSWHTSLASCEPFTRHLDC